MVKQIDRKAPLSPPRVAPPGNAGVRSRPAHGCEHGRQVRDHDFPATLALTPAQSSMSKPEILRAFTKGRKMTIGSPFFRRRSHIWNFFF